MTSTPGTPLLSHEEASHCPLLGSPHWLRSVGTPSLEGVSLSRLPLFQSPAPMAPPPCGCTGRNDSCFTDLPPGPGQSQDGRDPKGNVSPQAGRAACSPSRKAVIVPLAQGSASAYIPSKVCTSLKDLSIHF